MSRHKSLMKYEIIQAALELFFDVGYSNTSPKMISQKLGISLGTLTYHFPSKENLLEIVVQMLCDFQWKMLEFEADKGYGSAAAICLETMSVAVACDESEIARDFFVSTFQSESCRNYLRNNHVERAKKMFVKECDGWTDEQFNQAEIYVMGLQYAAIAPTDAAIPLKANVAGVLNQILGIYNVEEETRQREIEKMLAKDCRDISKRVLNVFIDFMAETSNKTLEQENKPIKEKTASAATV